MEIEIHFDIFRFIILNKINKAECTRRSKWNIMIWKWWILKKHRETFMVAVGVYSAMFTFHHSRHRCETEHFARLSTLAHWIPMMWTRVKSHLFSISFHHYRRCGCFCCCKIISIETPSKCENETNNTISIHERQWFFSTYLPLCLSVCLCGLPRLAQWAQVNIKLKRFSLTCDRSQKTAKHCVLHVLNDGAVKKIELISKISEKTSGMFVVVVHCHTQLQICVWNSTRSECEFQMRFDGFTWSTWSHVLCAKLALYCCVRIMSSIEKSQKKSGRGRK